MVTPGQKQVSVVMKVNVPMATPRPVGKQIYTGCVSKLVRCPPLLDQLQAMHDQIDTWSLLGIYKYAVVMPVDLIQI